MITSSGADSRRNDQRGLSPSLEMIILLPALMIMLGLIVTGGRIWFTRTAITEAAYSGARAASMYRSSMQAESAGRSATLAQLRMEGVRCQDRRIDLDVSGFDRTEGDRSSVTNAVRCRVRFADLTVPGLPGSLQLRGQSSAVIDHYRER